MRRCGANGARSSAFRLRRAAAQDMGSPVRAAYPGDHMTTFDDRERASRSSSRSTRSRSSRPRARRNRVLGEWAAGLMGLRSKHVAEYAQAVVKSDFEQPGDEDVLRKVFEDLKGAGVADHRGRSAHEDGRAAGSGPRRRPRRQVAVSARRLRRRLTFFGTMVDQASSTRSASSASIEIVQRDVAPVARADPAAAGTSRAAPRTGAPGGPCRA